MEQLLQWHSAASTDFRSIYINPTFLWTFFLRKTELPWWTEPMTSASLASSLSHAFWVSQWLVWHGSQRLAQKTYEMMVKGHRGCNKWFLYKMCLKWFMIYLLHWMFYCCWFSLFGENIYICLLFCLKLDNKSDSTHNLSACERFLQAFVSGFCLTHIIKALVKLKQRKIHTGNISLLDFWPLGLLWDLTRPKSSGKVQKSSPVILKKDIKRHVRMFIYLFTHPS